jgi:hypothetical protein
MAILDLASEEGSGVGRAWVDKWIMPARPALGPPLYFRPGWSTPEDQNLRVLRVIGLAELLYNLQTEEGIRDVYLRLIRSKEPAQLEPIILELEGLQALWLTRLPFRLRLPVEGRGLSYDCDVRLPNGHVVCCEMKCKPEGSQFTATGVRNALDYARKQLPADGCGVILMKAPEEWILSDADRAALEAAVRGFLQGTSRVAQVTTYVRPFVLTEMLAFRLATGKDFLNTEERCPCVRWLEGGLFAKQGSAFENRIWVPFWPLTPKLVREVAAAERANRPVPGG